MKISQFDDSNFYFLFVLCKIIIGIHYVLSCKLFD